MGNYKFIFVIFICIPVIFINISQKYDNFEADFIYVGQGDCTVLKDDGKCYIMDAGSNIYSPTGETILNQLMYDRITKINGIFISHMDYDHMGAILEIADKILIERIYISKYCEHNENYNNIIDTAKKYSIDIIYVNEHYSENLTKDMIIDLVFVDNEADNNNNSSPIYKVRYDNKTILFTGDIDYNVENMALNYDINADILKVPHHGSKYSVSKDFIDCVSPYIAINFAGYNNIYNHPAEETLKVYDDMKIPFLSTDKCGIIRIRMDVSGIYYKLLNSDFDTIQNLFY